ncbi:MAG: histidine phosphatase family protein [Candidatus Micrarchaeota archaeon]
MATTVYLMRHCQSVANAERRYNCTIGEDRGLSDEGKRQARRVSRFFIGRRIGAIYSSPFPRTMQTAGAVSEAAGAGVETLESFGELDCGEWDGRTESEIQSLFPDAWKGWHYDPQNNPIPGGESLLDVQTRVLPDFRKLVKRHENGSIAIVTHYCVFNVIICSLVSSLASFRSFDTGNGTIAEITMDNVPRLRFYSALPPQDI